DAEIHSSVSIGPYCVLGRCTLSEGVELKSHVVIEDRVHIGARTRIDAHSAIGVPGMAWIWSQEGERIMQPQLGGVVIEEDCLLASDISVVCGSLSENTRIGKGTVIAHGSKIGHGAQIEEYVHMANNVSLAGNAVIGHHSFLGSASVISSNITLPAHSIVGAGAVVNKNFTESYLTLAGVPAQIIRKNNYEEKPRGVPKPFKNNS
ncbi:MAG TPA: DapH/DapD/GlmU-related protein, partial [Chitinophagaceae bacterium]|nr:DapH/DapD/GlmU-related protein [Chitinophagaceae bacterium]